MKPKVYFINNFNEDSLLKLFNKIDKKLEGRVAIKLHSGEKGNQNFLKPAFWAPLIEQLNGAVVECNTAYNGARNTTKKHYQLIKEHEWDKYFEFDLMDAEGPDLQLDIPNGKILKKNFVGKNLANYDSLLVLSHFKGHPMGGYGGALKQLSIGCASTAGKAYIHSGGRTKSQKLCWLKLPKQEVFLEAMADAASSVVNYFKGNAIYINVMKNMSVDCDCCEVAEDPCLKDIGMLISLDPVAIDQACIDLVYAAKDDPGQRHFLDRVESRNGVHTIEAAAALGFGSREYELIDISNE